MTVINGESIINNVDLGETGIAVEPLDLIYDKPRAPEANLAPEHLVGGAKDAARWTPAAGGYAARNP